MYCGSNPTAILSQQQLAGAMLAEKPFSAISVSELCREASVSRQTFYSLFDSKESVITYTLTEHYCYSPEPEQGSGRGTLRQMCADYSDYLQSHADFLRTLEDNDIIYLLYDGFYESLMSCDCFFTGMAEEIRTYAADFMAGGFMSIARAYLRSGSRTDAALLEELIVGLFNGQLFRRISERAAHGRNQPCGIRISSTR